MRKRMQTSGFWLKLGHCGKFSQPYSLSVFEITVFMMKMLLGAAQGQSVRSGSVPGDTSFITLPSFPAQDGSLQCPTCKTIYGVKTGTQPPGKMEYHLIPHALPGHSDCKTIRIIYNIPPGVQVRPGPMHSGVRGWSLVGLVALVAAPSPLGHAAAHALPHGSGFNGVSGAL